MSHREIIERITAATAEIELAERDLWKVTSELDANPRAQKMVSETVQKAFADLRSARERLEALRGELTDSDDS